MKLLALATALNPVLALGVHGLASSREVSSHSDLDHRTTDNTKTFTFNQLYDLQTQFLDNFLYPKNVVQVG